MKKYVYCIESKDYVLRHYLDVEHCKVCSYYDAMKFYDEDVAKEYLRVNLLEEDYEITEHEELDDLWTDFKFPDKLYDRYGF